MEETEDIKTFETNFEQKLKAVPFGVDTMLDELGKFHETKAYQADKMAQLLQKKLEELHEVDWLVKLLSMRAAWNGDTPVFGMQLPRVLREASTDRDFLRNVDSAKFGKVKPSESLRRLSVLQSLTAGKCYFDKTWGYGEVKEVDNFNSRVYIDFPNKPNHSMSFEYAAETLEDVGINHILAFRHNHPEEFNAMLNGRPAAAEKDGAAPADDGKPGAKKKGKTPGHPGEIVKMAIESFGPSTVIRLQSLLVKYGIVTEAGWKDFWAAARRDLAGNKLVEIPAKRSDPIRIRKAALEYDDAWFEEFRKERDIPRIFSTLSAYEAHVAASGAKAELSPVAREVLDNRMTFAIDGAFLHKPPMFTRLVLMAQRLKVSTPRDKLVEALLDDDRFLMAGDKLPVGEASEMVEFIVDTRPDAIGVILDSLPEMNYSLLRQTLAVLRGKPEFLPALQDRVRELLSSTSAPATLVVWALRDNRWEDLANWKLPSLYELMEHAIAICEDQAAAGEQLHMQHYVRELYLKSSRKRIEAKSKDKGRDKSQEAEKGAEVDTAGWFQESFKVLKPLQQEAIFMRLQNNAAVAEPRYQRELVKEMIAINPDLASKRRSSIPVAAAAPEQHFSSWRSLREHREQFRHLVEVEIPKNTQDISFARGYGDLRENFEYQSAKDQQRILLARREEWSMELEKMHGSSFSETKFGYSVVEPGCEVALEKGDGSVLVYSILGEWDSDETLGIIPSRSRLAKLVEGKKVGEKAAIPTAVGEEEVVVKAIAPLSPAVREWIGQPFAENA